VVTARVAPVSRLFTVTVAPPTLPPDASSSFPEITAEIWTDAELALRMSTAVVRTVLRKHASVCEKEMLRFGPQSECRSSRVVRLLEKPLEQPRSLVRRVIRIAIYNEATESKEAQRDNKHVDVVTFDINRSQPSITHCVTSRKAC
jgi:hypothetical protein